MRHIGWISHDHPDREKMLDDPEYFWRWLPKFDPPAPTRAEFSEMVAEVAELRKQVMRLTNCENTVTQVTYVTHATVGNRDDDMKPTPKLALIRGKRR
ncbi:MAG: hypothetical protein HJJLKODD_00556 [Phycisphaerae bacterium]|nr:hypothetical protein [Phycisphaerae bacterium]